MSKPTERRSNQPSFIYGVVRKIGSNEVMEVHRIDTKTNKKETTFQHPDYKKVLQKEGIA